MGMHKRIVWGPNNPFSDPRLRDIDLIVGLIRTHRPLPAGVEKGAPSFQNREGFLPARPPGYWNEYYLTLPGPTGVRDKLRLILGGSGLTDEVFITGNHYEDPRQIIGMPIRF